jgi:hypothetical protein
MVDCGVLLTLNLSLMREIEVFLFCIVGDSVKSSRHINAAVYNTTGTRGSVVC